MHSADPGAVTLSFFMLESLQGQRELIEACVQDLIFLSREDRDLGSFLRDSFPGGVADLEDPTHGEGKTTWTGLCSVGEL